MTSHLIAAEDPAAALWRRCPALELSIIGDLFESSPVKVGEIASRLGISVVGKTMNSEISGLIRRGPEGFVIEVNNTDVGVRQRFTVCHELSHYLLHRELIDNDGITDSILFRSKLSNKLEVEANRLAAAMLIPWNLVNKWHKEIFNDVTSIANIDAIANHFKASRLAVGFRFGF